MKLKQYWEKHAGIIETALCDYLRWFEDGEENQDTIQQALNDINNIEDLN